jgi:hypothetical protein
MKKLIVLGAFLTFVIISASAQTGIRDRASHQRIERGFDGGQLSRSEKYRLHRNEARFKHERRRAFRDGRITPSERRRLHKMKRHNRHETFRMKHNGRRRLI